MTAIDTCGSDGFHGLLEVWTGTCDSLELIARQDNCTDSFTPWDAVDPLASCFDDDGQPPIESDSCACLPTTVGRSYWLTLGTQDLGDIVNVTLSKRLECGVVWENGACCDASGDCVDDVAGGDCADPGDVWSAQTPCASIACDPGPGACCHGTTGDCAQTLASDCTGANRVWAPGTTCPQIVCDPTPGACCDFADVDPLTGMGACTDGAILADCQGETNAWTKGAVCAAVACHVDVVVPTVSEWGLVVLGLVLVILAKLAFGVFRLEHRPARALGDPGPHEYRA